MVVIEFFIRIIFWSVKVIGELQKPRFKEEPFMGPGVNMRCSQLASVSLLVSGKGSLCR
jgi:hypothetical protein